MAAREFPLVPRSVGEVRTRYRRIQTDIPVPESVSVLQRLRRCEPRSMGGQPPIIWDSGDGSLIRDPYGNQWIDFSSGVLVTASGHGHPAIRRAICREALSHLYHSYGFPTLARADLVEKLCSILPNTLSRVFLLTTGAEACECAVKLARTHGARVGGRRKSVLVSFHNAFHGRTMGSQLAGGSPALKQWLQGGHPNFVQVPYPDGFRCQDTSFSGFLSALEQKGIQPDRVCGVMSETYQGCNAALMPETYVQSLREWCTHNKAVLILDEVQAGFGRTGTMFGFEHYGIVPDIACFGKGISGGMPLSAVAGTEELMSLYGPGEMTSTHSANPVCCAAALANIQTILDESLADNAKSLQPILLESGRQMMADSNGHIARADGVGLVMALQFVKPGTTDPDPDLAFEVVQAAVERGVMLFAPVGVGGGAIKINPPLVIIEEILREGLDVIGQIVQEKCAAS